MQYKGFMIINNPTVYISTKGETGDIEEFIFYWIDQKQGSALWSKFSAEDTYVMKSKENTFKHVQQPCVECWGEECDEGE